MPRFLKNRGEGSIPVVPWENCFAKSTEDGDAGIPVFDHCMATGRVAEEIWKSRFPEKPMPTGFPFLVAAHDAGKVSPGFLKHCSNHALQTLCPELAVLNNEALQLERNHAEIGEAAFIAWAAKRGMPHG